MTRAGVLLMSERGGAKSARQKSAVAPSAFVFFSLSLFLPPSIIYAIHTLTDSHRGKQPGTQCRYRNRSFSQVVRGDASVLPCRLASSDASRPVPRIDGSLTRR